MSADESLDALLIAICAGGALHAAATSNWPAMFAWFVGFLAHLRLFIR